MKNSERTQDHLKSRRTFLRGAGVALALPWMESLPLFAQDAASAVKAVDPNKPPGRFACLYFSNGVDPKNWWAKGAGKDMQFGPAAEPLTACREDLVFIRGLYNQLAFQNPSPHMGRMANMLSGARVSNDPSDIHVGSTMDQVLAKQIGNRT